MALARLDDSLGALGISEIACIERPFDATVMRAVDVTNDSSVADGTVLEVLRTGYRWQGETWRSAEVRVSRNPSGEERRA